MKSLNYGTVPMRHEFEKAFKHHVSGSAFHIRNDKRGRNGAYTPHTLYALVETETKRFERNSDNEAGDFASCVLYSLGFEWI